MKRKVVSLLLAFAACAGSAQSNDDQVKATLEQAKSMAKSEAARTQSGISSPTVGADPASLVPKFSNSSPGQSQYFGNGQGDTKQPGTNKMIECGNATSDQLAGYDGKVCDAINFLVKQPTARPAFTISKNDPLIRSASSQISNIKSQLPITPGKDPRKLDNCTTETIPGKDEYRTEICQETGNITDSKCTVSHIVEVIPEYRYQCLTQLKKVTKTSCDRVMGSVCISAVVSMPDASKTYSCPIPTGGFYTQNCWTAGHDNVERCDPPVFQTYASIIKEPPRFISQTTCHYFAAGSSYYLSTALLEQFGMRTYTINQDYGQFEIGTTAAVSLSCPVGKLSGDKCEILSCATGTGSLTPATAPNGSSTSMCCKDTVVDNCAWLEAQSQ